MRALRAPFATRGVDRTLGPLAAVVGDLRGPPVHRQALEDAWAVVHVAALHAPHVGQVADSEFREGHWVLDRSASTIGIANRTMGGLATVKGEFTSFQGESHVEVDGTVTGTMNIEAASIDTHNKTRDQHLKSKDFFDAEHHRLITVHVASATLHDRQLELDAELEVKGTRESIHLAARIQDAATDRLSLVVDGSVDRRRFAMSWNKLGMITGTTSIRVTALFRRQ